MVRHNKQITLDIYFFKPHPTLSRVQCKWNQNPTGFKNSSGAIWLFENIKLSSIVWGEGRNTEILLWWFSTLHQSLLSKTLPTQAWLVTKTPFRETSLSGPPPSEKRWVAAHEKRLFSCGIPVLECSVLLVAREYIFICPSLSMLGFSIMLWSDSALFLLVLFYTVLIYSLLF